MLIIRFLRTGKKNQPFFRLVVTDKRRAAKTGRFLEVLGFFNPLTKEKNLKKERLEYWISQGAQTSDRVHNLLVKEGILKEKKIPVHKKSKNKEKTESEPPKQENEPSEEKKPETGEGAAKKQEKQETGKETEKQETEKTDS